MASRRYLDEELDRVSGLDGRTVAIGALPVAATGVLPGALTRLKASHPDVRVRLQQGRGEELLPLLAAGETASCPPTGAHSTSGGTIAGDFTDRVR